VFVYNRIQERRAGGEAERSFRSTHADVLMGDGRVEPSAAAAAPALLGRPPRIPPEAMPDPRVDYVMALSLASPAAGVSVLEAWRPIETRFARRVLLIASDGAGWHRLAPGDAHPAHALHASLQLVTRSGVVGDAELVEFRSAVETFAAGLHASIAAPEMREALHAARELDRSCADADIQVALHVVGERVTMQGTPGELFQVSERSNGVTLTLDMPRTRDPGRAYEAMARAARRLAAEHGGRIIDDNGNALYERSLASIGAELDVVRRGLEALGVEPGGPLELRLFS